MGIRIVYFPRKRYKMFDPREASGIINISIAQRNSRGSSDTPEEQGERNQFRLGWVETTSGVSRHWTRAAPLLIWFTHWTSVWGFIWKGYMCYRNINNITNSKKALKSNRQMPKCYKWGNWSWERINDLFKTMQLVKS